MSCFVMETRAIAALARGMETVLNSGYRFAGFDAPKTLADFLAAVGCCDKFGYFEEKKIFVALYDLNMQAYAGRYEEEAEPAPAWPDNVPRLLNKPAYHGYYKPDAYFWKYLKLLDCLIYQVTEDATIKAPLRGALVDFERTLSVFLARNCAAYDTAEWGRL